ncbi:MAG: hypothetical protein QOD77_1654 [Thermoplasmata archaeon]|jgi:F0F1-type ATP synthase membrane subunit b/b'|nr:hypothetical protein [Thermoplasmata archaeon]
MRWHAVELTNEQVVATLVAIILGLFGVLAFVARKIWNALDDRHQALLVSVQQLQQAERDLSTRLAAAEHRLTDLQPVKDLMTQAATEKLKKLFGPSKGA